MSHNATEKTASSDSSRPKLTATAEDIKDLEAELEAQKNLTILLKTKLEEQNARLEDLSGDLHARELEIEQIRKSTSWAVTSPFRTIVQKLSRLGFTKGEQSKPAQAKVPRDQTITDVYGHSSHQPGAPARRKVKQYQSLDGLPGSSDSQAKLQRLMLDRLKRPGARRPFEGFSVLDLGCNEGFFCNAARELGATRIVGIDRSEDVLQLARQRFPDITFVHGTWWDAPDEQFDVILFLSAIHYEPEQKRLLDFLTTRLKPEGTLVLECGVVDNTSRVPGTGWRAIQRGDGLKRYPTLSYLWDVLLASYAPRAAGPSVSQRGDPIPRMVLHCTPRRPMALLISGAPKSGKSTLAHLLRSNGILTYSIDSLFSRLVTDETYFRSDLSKWLRDQLGEQRSWRAAAKLLVKHARELEFSEQVVAELPFDNTAFFAIEGEALCYRTVQSAIHRTLQGRGVIVWAVDRLQSAVA